MYGRIKEQKLRTNNINFSVESVKNELEGFIDDENKRVNIDSAKKRAVLQGMDYGGFRQMVLGAHLFSIKSKELIDMSADRVNKKNEIVLNSSLTTFNNVVDLSARQKEEIEQINLRIAEMLANNELQANSFRDFKKNFDSQYKFPIDDVAAQNIYLIFKSQKEENFKKIFSLDFDVSYFIKIIKVMKYVIQESLVPNQNALELLFLMEFLDQMSKVKDFQFSVPKFLSSKEKVELKEFMEFLKQSIQQVQQTKVDSQDKQLKEKSDENQIEQNNEVENDNKENLQNEQQQLDQENSNSDQQNQQIDEKILQDLFNKLESYYIR
ncbi:RPAP3 monad-binding domain protein, putative (macronuclear) [Tetrahymena thermophila SB210]|uniref:RPAP3 monad-binding domain protein, putative n=1 Tax=Tetrahymena thermophila (strain SB210) TaxID=312017 RepID=I7MKE6_TETTS|nr:RPAP3 monad-binding domain protein, putative [Tetrahymena thermophila SB210]EAR98280.2 RPAP3 monad-binding domain protein, putative [Tetrahymena thermophila SB210]|eukprot:XP_001018525.2 RPAP3 monad-binding domain protein, putative [Tetrahymena thermophila SB210]